VPQTACQEGKSEQDRERNVGPLDEQVLAKLSKSSKEPSQLHDSRSPIPIPFFYARP
jgi:hypothetical protein